MPSAGDLPDPGIEPGSPELQAILYQLSYKGSPESESCSVVSDSLRPLGLYIQSMEFSRPEYWSGQPFPSPGNLPNPGIKPRSPTLQSDYLPAKPPGKPKNTGVGSLSLLQQIFLTQEPNQGLLHYRQIPYQLSYQGSFCVYTNIFTHML